MADMRSLVFLPLALAATSCIPTVPYHQQRPPYRNGEPFYPYGRGPAAEHGRYEPVPDRTPPPPGFEPRDPAPPREFENDPEPPRPQPKPRREYPVAERTEKPGMVISPYAPYNVIDVEGFQSGALAKDPSNGKIFRVP